MKIIGITGKSGTGKTTFASYLSRVLSCKNIDIDKIGHQASSNPEILNSLCSMFGSSILDKNNNLDRKKLGTIVFSSESEMDKLTDLTWGYMAKTIDNILSQNTEIIILEWALLPNSKYWDKCDYKILVTSNDIQRKNKIILRDNISEEYFQKRELAGIDYSLFKFDYIFQNDYKSKTLEKFVEKIILEVK